MSHVLFDTLIDECGVTGDVELAKLLDFSTARICEYRKGKINIGPGLILRVYDKVGMSIERIRELAADTTTPKVLRKRKVSAPAPKKVKQVVLPIAVVPHAVGKESMMTITETPKWVSRVHRCM